MKILFKQLRKKLQRRKKERIPKRDWRRSRFWIAMTQIGKASILGFLVVGTYFLIRPTTPYQAYRLQLGDVSTVEIIAPMDIEITDDEETTKKREEAQSRVLPVYIEIPNASQRGTEQLEQVLELASELVLLSTEEHTRILNRAQESFGLVLDETEMLKLSNESFQRDVRAKMPVLLEGLFRDGIVESEEDLSVLQQRARNGLRIKVGTNEYRLRVSFSGIRSLEQAREDLTQLIQDRFTFRDSPELLDLLISVGTALLEPTLRYDVQDTQRQVEQRLRQVDDAVIRIRQGERIVGPHQRVDDEVIKKLDALKKAHPSFGLINSIGWLLLVLIPYAAGAAYAHKYAPNFWHSGSALTSLALLSFITVALARVASILPRLGEPFSQSAYAVPLGVSGILLTVLVNGQLAVFWTSVLCLLIAPLLGWDMREIGTLYVGTVFGVLGVIGVTKRTDLYKAGFWIAFGCVMTFLAVTFSSKSSLSELLSAGRFTMYGLIPCVLNGIISATLAIALLPLYEDWLGITTDIKLLEVQMKTGILKELAQKAPGTYQHSINVSMLAEAAAEAIGANPLLARVGALYHDIGKIAKASYFSENQFTDADRKKHSKLSANMSCFIIRNHIKDGQDMARKQKLPRVITDFISQHHGTTLLTFFYDQALGEDDKGSVQEETYRYYGPRPQSKESAIVMLADSVEAASRSLPELSEGELKQFVRKIVNDKFMDDQFDECDLTMHDLHLLSESLALSLNSLMHRRVRYPTPEEIAEKQRFRQLEMIGIQTEEAARIPHADLAHDMEIQSPSEPPPVSAGPSIDIRSEVESFSPQSAEIRKQILEILESHGSPNSEVSVLFTDDEHIKELNFQYRQIDAPTNVLSFLQQESTEHIPGISEGDEGMPPFALGDIVISVERAASEARESDKSLEERIQELIAHGLEHLLGIHHEE